MACNGEAAEFFLMLNHKEYRQGLKRWVCMMIASSFAFSHAHAIYEGSTGVSDVSSNLSIWHGVVTGTVAGALSFAGHEPRAKGLQAHQQPLPNE